MSNSKEPAEYTPPASPSGSYYDLSDDDENEYNTITHTSTGRSVKLLFSKSKVYIHPSASSRDNIPGFIALLQQKPPSTSSTNASSSSSTSNPPPSSLLLTWMPETALGDAYDTYVKVDLTNGDTPPRQTYLVPPPPSHYTTGTSSLVTYAFAVPVSQIFSLLIRPPNLGWWWGSLIINTRAGDSFPALFFHDSECASTIAQSKRRQRDSFDPFGETGQLFWGGDEVLRWLRRYARVEKSRVEPSLYLVDPSEEDLRSLVAKPVVDGLVGKNAASTAAGEGGGAGMDPFTRVLKEARWNFLEKLTRVTRFTRRTAEDIIDSPKVPDQVKKLLRSPEVQSLQDEFDSARLYLARWAMGIAEQSERENRQRVWTTKDVMELEESSVGEFEILDMELGSMRIDAEKRKPVGLKEWNSWFDAKSGRLVVAVDEVKERIFHGGIEDNGARKEIWLWLLDVYPWDSTREERMAIMNSKRDEYIRLKGKWWDDVERRSGDEYWRDQKNRIEKDVHRTDRTIPIFSGEDTPHPDPDSTYFEIGTNIHLEQLKDLLLTYNEFNPTLGYVQGMSDLLSPLYAILQDDALAFWAFAGFMHRMERNFLRDQSGMREQLVTLDHLVNLMDPPLYAHLQKADSTNFFFFFRMLIVWFKREFEWDDVLRLWEVLWTNYRSSQYQLFIALAVLEKHRFVVIEHLTAFDEVLKYVNELSGTMELGEVLLGAERLWGRFKMMVEAVDRRSKGDGGLGNVRRRGEGEVSGERGGSTIGGGKATGMDGDKGKGREEAREAISPELRRLLGREVVRPTVTTAT